MPGQVGRPGWHLLPQEDRGGQVLQGSAAVPQEAHLGCRLQEPHGRFAGTLARRRLTKRSRESDVGEVRRIYLLGRSCIRQDVAKLRIQATTLSLPWERRT